MIFLRLKNRTSPRSRQLDATLRKTGLHNIFNLSTHVSDAQSTLVFRALAPGQDKPFHAFMLTVPLEGEDTGPLVNLTTLFEEQIGFPVADPKLFEWEGNCWVTFNTGHFARPNAIYVAQLTPEIGPPLKVDLPERADIEKNWGFFEWNGVLHAIYSLDPLVVLRAKLRTTTELHFEHMGTAPAGWDKTPKLTIGTQPAPLPGRPGCFALIAHRRHYFRKKRLYTGRAIVLDMNISDLQISTRPWFHSLRALRGAQIRHNRNLLSCSYFAGLCFAGNRALVSYGINDVDFGIADLPVSPWQELANRIKGKAKAGHND